MHRKCQNAIFLIIIKLIFNVLLELTGFRVEVRGIRAVRKAFTHSSKNCEKPKLRFMCYLQLMNNYTADGYF